MFSFVVGARMALQADFFGAHTERKLDVIARYLQSYTTVLKRSSFETIFFDAFAGTGEMPSDRPSDLLSGVEEVQPFVEGSARRALAVEPPFSRYIFVERMKGKAQELSKLREEFAHRSIATIHGEANFALQEFCTSMTRSQRAVVFLDPFGNQVSWETLVAIAKTGAIDLWYLFPAGLGVTRQISNRANFDNDKAASLDRLFGTIEWRNQFVRRDSVTELDGTTREVATKQADADFVTRYMIGRMREIFKGGVLDAWLPLGERGGHWYSLLFAWANPNRAAGDIAERIAKHLMTRR